MITIFKGLIRSVLDSFGFEIRKKTFGGGQFNRSPQIGGPDSTHYLSIEKLNLTPSELATIDNFRSDRYFWINEYRWRLLARTGITLKDKVIFEPGAGIGDQTAWLLNQGARKVIVSEGREINLSVIAKRFQENQLVEMFLGDLESCIDNPKFEIRADIVFLWGVYYHILDPVPTFPILQKLAKIAPTIVLDYQKSLTGVDWIEHYEYENTSASISHSSWRLTPRSMIKGLHDSFGFVYLPVEQMQWNDPSTLHAPRRIIIASVDPLDWPGLVSIY